MDDFIQQLEILLPLACTWAEEQERLILQFGVALTGTQLAVARRIGVIYPEKVRLLRVRAIPPPKDPPVLASTAKDMGLITSNTGGLTLRYGIFVRVDCWEDCNLIAHELVHTRQYEHLGSIEGFLKKYLMECATVGYPNAPMELEAIRIADEICSSKVIS
jgi:hypothetical protein